MSGTRDDIEAMIPKVNELASNKVVVVVDPISTGCTVAFEAFQRGYKVICVWSVEASPEMRTHAPQSCESILPLATLEQGSTLEATGVAVKKAVDNLQLSAVTVGGESGFSCRRCTVRAPRASHHWHTDPAEANKKLQQELAKEAGLRSVRQAGGTQQSDIQDFLLSEQMPSVVKPVESAGQGVCSRPLLPRW